MTRRTTASLSAGPGVRLVALLGLALVASVARPAPAAHELVVAAGRVADNFTNTSIYYYDIDEDVWIGPTIASDRMPLYPNDAFAESVRLATGGYRCPLHFNTGDPVIPCLAGTCGQPYFSAANGSLFPRDIGVDDRNLLGCRGDNSTGTSRLACTLYDTMTDEVDHFFVDIPTLPAGLLNGTFPDVHAIGGVGDDYDVVVRYFDSAGNREYSQAVRIDGNGNLVDTFDFPSNFFAIDGTWEDGNFYAVEGSQNGAAGFGITLYEADDYDRLRRIVPLGSVLSRQSFAVVRTESLGLVAIAYDTGGALSIFRLSNGLKVRTISPPPNEGFVVAFTEATCSEDLTTTRIGPGFRIELSGDVTKPDGEVVPIQFAVRSSPDSVEGFFLEPDNREFLVKVIDACSFTGTYWLIGAAATTAGFELTAEDVETGRTVTFTNPVRNNAEAFANTSEFVCEDNS